MKIVSLNSIEAAATGFTHIVNVKVANGDLATATTTRNIMPIPVGYWVKDIAIDIRTAWNNLTLPSFSIGVNTTGASATDLFNAVDLSESGVYSGSSSGVVCNTASSFITITQNGAGTTANAGEANILFRLVDLTHGRRTFAN